MTPDSLIAALRARECADDHHEDAATFLPPADLIADAREARRAAERAAEPPFAIASDTDKGRAGDEQNETLRRHPQ